MDALVHPSALAGRIRAVPSKSAFHRAAFIACLADAPTTLICPETSDDIEATLDVIAQLGARVEREGDRIVVSPAPVTAEGTCKIFCGESGTTMRFALPVAAALGRECAVSCSGRLPQRPIGHLVGCLEAGGIEVSPEGTWPLTMAGTLAGGAFTLPGNISSQYASGMLLAAAAGRGLELHVTRPVESLPYIELTCRLLEQFGVSVGTRETPDEIIYSVAEGERACSPGTLVIEGDWSGAATWIAASAVGADIDIAGLDASTLQADVALLGILEGMGAQVTCDGEGAIRARGPLAGSTVDISMCPDLAPTIAALACCATGETRIEGAARLRLKESDRLLACQDTVNALGGYARIDGDCLVICGGTVRGGACDAQGDHRIAMMAALMSTFAAADVLIRGADCVSKSYPAFWRDFELLGGSFEMIGA